MTTLSYPTWVAGEDITADKLNSMLPRFALKTADESVTSSTTMQNDDELLFSVDANATYAMDGWLKYSAATNPGDINIQFTTPSGTLGEWTGIGNGTTVYTGSGGVATTTDTASSVGYMVRTESSDVGAARAYGGIAGATNVFAVQIKGTWRTSSTAGTLQLQWAQNGSSATATTVYTDSWFRLQRIS